MDCGKLPLQKVAIGGDDGLSPTFFVTGTDPDRGGLANQIVNMAVEANDFIPTGLDNTVDSTFMIVIETAAPIGVQLADGSQFTITTVMATTYLGDIAPLKLKKVFKAGTTGTFSVVF